MADERPHSDTEPDASDEESPLPGETIDRAETLTRRARAAIDGNEREAYLEERDRLLSAHGYEARVREGDTGATLVLYPAEWLDDGSVRLERIEDTDRAIERPISGPGSDADWESVDGHNREIATRVRKRHGEVHGETAAAFADFMSNHYAKPIEDATPAEREEFRTEYFPRNAWPSEAQRERVEESVQLALEVAEET
jgi:hypothetical protein